MSSPAPKSEDLLAAPAAGEDEEDMTSIMSADQRKQLQQAASDSKAAETLERDTAKPPPSAEAAEAMAEVVIPKAPATPSLGAPAKVRADSTKPAAIAKPSAPAASAPAGWSAWELAAFVLLAAAVAVALRM
jgi:hypothetical protein